MPYLGELAGFSVAVLWAIGSILFAWSSQRVGALFTNAIRIVLAALILCVLHALLFGTVWPSWISGRSLWLLAVSGIVGLVLGDGCYFRSLVLLGARRASVLLSLSPALTALGGWIFLSERLGAQALVGMVLSLAGTIWVVSERGQDEASLRPWLGALFGLGAALGQAAGLLLAKPALEGLEPLSGTVVRMAVAALAGLLPLGLRLSRRREAPQAMLTLPLAGVLITAAFIGPVAGVWLSLVAITHTETGIAATLMALVPIVIIPIDVLIHRRLPSVRAVLGATVALAGVALILLR